MNIKTQITNVTEGKQSVKISDSLRTRCLVYTRVMGYHRPVESFNIGKKGEHQQRKHFLENCEC
jgi:hypothetical protein